MSSAILSQYDIDDEGNGMLKLDADSILSPLDPSTRGCNSGTNGCICDKLLQEFHRFDEGLSVQGKWAGGSVTGVCRGWGTSKVRNELAVCYLGSSLEELFNKYCPLCSLVCLS